MALLNPLIVTDGLCPIASSRIAATLAEAGVSSGVFSEISPNPSVRTLNGRANAIARAA